MWIIQRYKEYPSSVWLVRSFYYKLSCKPQVAGKQDFVVRIWITEIK